MATQYDPLTGVTYTVPDNPDDPRQRGQQNNNPAYNTPTSQITGYTNNAETNPNNLWNFVLDPSEGFQVAPELQDEDFLDIMQHLGIDTAMRQREWAQDYRDFWQQYQRPVQEEMARQNLNLVPQIGGLQRAQIGQQRRLLPHQEHAIRNELATRAVEAHQLRRLYPHMTDTQIEQLATQRSRTRAERGLIPFETGMAREQYKLGARQAEAGQRLLPHEEAMMRSQLGLGREQAESGRRLLPHEEAMMREQYGLGREEAATRRGLLPHEAAMLKEQYGLRTQAAQQGREELQASRPVMYEFYKQALQGADPNLKAQQAKADVAQQFKDRDAILSRAAGRYGLSSGAFKDKYSQATINQAKATAGAMTQARTQAEDENFQRLQQAAGYRRGLF